MLDGPPAVEPVEPVDPGLVADLRTALAVWRRSPWMPVAGVLLSLWVSLQDVFGTSNGLVFVLTLPALVAGVAWPGVERLWYLRAFRGERLRIRETRRFVGAYFWRYAILGLFVSLPVGFLCVVLYALDPTVGRAGLVALVLVLDVALTFVTPALAYTTRRVRIALRVGFDMIRDEWPRCMWYVLAPPLAFGVLSQVSFRSAASGAGVGMALSATAMLLGLACKGAIAAFYLRRWPTGPDGAAFVDADVPLPAPTRTAAPRRPDRPRRPSER
jgi:hypothetical protein